MRYFISRSRARNVSYGLPNRLTYFLSLSLSPSDVRYTHPLKMFILPVSACTLRVGASVGIRT